MKTRRSFDDAATGIQDRGGMQKENPSFQVIPK
jgi:hypothetical protein